MGIKQTQISYDEHWFDRKVAIGKKCTWKLIMRAGIIALEEQKKQGEEVLQHTLKGLTADNIESTQPEPPLEPVPVQTEKIRIVLSKPHNIGVRSFDVLRENKWQSVEPDDIVENEIFRIRDDESVIEHNGNKSFSLQTKPVKENGMMIAEVISV